MHNVRSILLSATLLCVLTTLYLTSMPRLSTYIPLLWTTTTQSASPNPPDGQWYPPKQTWANDLTRVINGSGTYGFIFNGSGVPEGTKYGGYNYCNMPHIRSSEYPIVSSEEYELRYVEIIHRHHKRTPYASNTFPTENYGWDCSSQGLFTYSELLDTSNNSISAAHTYTSLYTSPLNPFHPPGYRGTCQFPQLTSGGLYDSYQHGRDIYNLYHNQLNFLPKDYNPNKLQFRITNNILTSQVASMLISGIYPSLKNTATPLSLQPSTIDSLEPRYPCPAATNLYNTYGVGSTSKNWTRHLLTARPLFRALDTISGIHPESNEWHKSLDHYFDNLSTRQCDGKPLPCNTDKTSCVTQEMADIVYRLAEYEYSFIYRDEPASLDAAVGSYGVWIAELAQNIRDAIDGRSEVVYRHNVAHDGSVSRLLGILQVEEMVWPGMGAEVVFEVYKGLIGEREGKWFVRILWGGRTLVSSYPLLGKVEMLDVEVLIGYFEGLVGRRAEKVVGFCGGGDG